MNRSSETIEKNGFPSGNTGARFTRAVVHSVSEVRPFGDNDRFLEGTQFELQSTQSSCPCCGAALNNQRMHVDLDTNTFLFREHSVPLGPVQAEVLEVLVRRSPGVVSNDAMIRAVWGIDEPVHAKKNVEVHIYKLRKHLAPAGVAIKNIFGVGYQLVVENRS